tara:strand:+ start:276 stop:437 length:162 start_codon:yes stop_codon:yes gene_type:complete
MRKNEYWSKLQTTTQTLDSALTLLELYKKKIAALKEDIEYYKEENNNLKNKTQ